MMAFEGAIWANLRFFLESSYLHCCGEYCDELRILVETIFVILY